MFVKIKQNLIIEFFILLYCCNYVFATVVLNDNITLIYDIKINSVNNGTIYLTKDHSKFISKYNNVSTNNRLPFYFPDKSGIYNDNFLLKTINFSNQKYDIYYDYNQIPSSIKLKKAYKNKNKAFIIDNKSMLIKYIIDNIPVVTFENIILGFLNKKILEKKEMILFEEGSKSLFRIYFKLSQNNCVQIINGRKKSFKRYYCLRKNIPGQKDKELFIIDITNNYIPLRIASLSGRWEIIMKEIFSGNIIFVNINDYIKEIAEKKIQSKYGSSYDKSNLNIDNIQQKYDQNNQYYMYDFTLNKKIMQSQAFINIAAKYFKKVYFPDEIYEPHEDHISIFDNKFIIHASLNEINKLYAKKYYFENEKNIEVDLYEFIKIIQPYYKNIKLETCDTASKQTVICYMDKNGKPEILDIDNAAAQHYINSKYKNQNNFVIDNSYAYSYSSNYSDFDSVISISYKEIISSRINETIKKEIAVKIISYKLFHKEPYVEKNIYQKLKKYNDGYAIEITKNIIDQFVNKRFAEICSKKYSDHSNNVIYRSGNCEIKGKGKINIDDIKYFIRNKIIQSHSNFNSNYKIIIDGDLCYIVDKDETINLNY